MAFRTTLPLFLVTVAPFIAPASAAWGQAVAVPHGVVVKTQGLNVQVLFYAGDTVRVTKWLPEGSPERKSLVVIQEKLPELAFERRESAEAIALVSKALTVSISKSDGSVTVARASGEVVLKEDGKATLSPVSFNGDKGYSLRQRFTLTPGEGIYGLGQHQDGYMNYRGRSVTLVQANTQSSTPFLVSTNGYGLLWDNTSKTIFKDGPEGLTVTSDIGDNLDYYVMQGDSIDGAIAGYRKLTGAAPLYGKWAYGYWQSKEHYHTQDEVVSIAREYRKRGIPIDNLIQDWNYWGTNQTWSGMIFDPVRYPDPDGMVKTLHGMNFHLAISIWGGLGPDSELYKEMDKGGFLFKPTGWAGFRYYDAFNPKANDLYWKHLKKGLYDRGIDGWWQDSTEPDIINALSKESTEYEMKRVENTHLGSWARYLNAYPLMITGGLYDHLRHETDQRRAYILTRSAFAGQQRNAATTWSGDIGASWEIYRRQISAGINHSMAGIPYWTFDIGGFVLGSYGGVFDRGIKEPAYQELYTRMFQLGAFSPIFRAHGSEGPREIWEFGAFSDALLKADRWRYRLLPYLYSQAWRVTSEGQSIMRGLPMDFPKDTRTFGIDDQYLFGPSIMVCPVTSYMLHRPPEATALIPTANLRTKDGQPGVTVTYCKDVDHKAPSLQRVEPNVDLLWYTGRPDFVTESTFSIRWEGKLVPTQSGPHQLHVKSFGARHLYLDGKAIPFLSDETMERYTAPIELEAGRAYDLTMEIENPLPGAVKAQLCWRTPDQYAREKQVEPRPKTRSVYLPAGTNWVDFWTGRTLAGGQTLEADAPIDRIPLLVKAGSILPLGPDVQFASEKPADPIELRVYPGANARFTLYEDEGDTYRYEKGQYATIEFRWDDAKRQLTLGERKGSFPGMLKHRRFHVVLVGEGSGAGHGAGMDLVGKPDRVVAYDGREARLNF
ncbi:MAG TPA: glycoside hydrolase family 31 protein [Holophaga sp.]|nr:glycoside hydrolase family 31 protein [Holophaga sp.]